MTSSNGNTFRVTDLFVRGIHQSPVNSPHKGQWHRALMFSLICAWINGWVNNRAARDLRRHRFHYDVTVMFCGALPENNVIVCKSNSEQLKFDFTRPGSQKYNTINNIHMVYLYIQQECHSVLVKLHPITFLTIVILGSARILGWMPLLFSLVYQLCLALW